MLQALQYIDICKTQGEADHVFAFLQTQVDYLGGRILTPSPSKPDWRVQVFFESDGQQSGWLPDGVSRVSIPEGQRKALNIQ